MYLDLSDEDKKDAEIIRLRLMRAFSESPCMAYEKLKKMKWTYEFVDVYAKKIQRLIGLIGFVGTSSNLLAKLAFTTGFPDQISRELHQVNGFEKMDFSQLIPRARVLTCNRPLETKLLFTIYQPLRSGRL